jgi:hypothetical protein
VEVLDIAMVEHMLSMRNVIERLSLCGLLQAARCCKPCCECLFSYLQAA